MPNQSDIESQQEVRGELTFKLLFAPYRRYWLVGALLVCAMFGLSMLYLFVATPTYLGTLYIKTPARSINEGQPTDASGGIAAIFSRRTGNSTDFFIETMESMATAQILANDPKIMHNLFPAQWNSETQTWQKPENFIQDIKDSIYGPLGLPSWSPPSAENVNAFINKRVELTPIGGMGSYEIGFEHMDPEFIKYFLNSIYTTVDYLLRQERETYSEKAVAYYRQRISESDQVEVRAALATLVSQEQRLLMLAQSDLPIYAAQLGDIWVSTRPANPRPLMVGIMGILIGLVLSFLIIPVIAAVRQK